MLWLCNALITALCRNQTVEAMSSPEAEYYACSVAFAEVKYVTSLLADWGLAVKSTHVTDSSSAIVHASRLGLGGIRHMEVRYLWVQHEVRSGRIPIKKIAGFDNPTDIATKHVDTETMKRCQASAGLRRWSPSTGIIIALTLLPVAAAADETEGGVGAPFWFAMACAVFGIGQAGMYIAAAVSRWSRSGRITSRTVGTQTVSVIEPLVPPRRYFITQKGDCYHSRENCKGLATRTTVMTELGNRPPMLRPCSRCHNELGEPS